MNSSKRWGLFVVVALVLAALVGRVSATEGFDQAPRIAIISAFGAELEAFKAQAVIEKAVVLNGRTVYIGTLAGHKVILTLSGVSMVNAAMTTEAVLDHFRITRIVYSGIAGGVNPDLNIGDVVVPARWAEYQENRFVRQNPDGTFQVPPNQVLPCYGMMCPQSVGITTVIGTPDRQTRYWWFDADPEMVAVAESIADDVVLDRCTASGVCLTESPVVKVGGYGVAGPTFVDNAAYRDYAFSTWEADSLDMESSAVAQVAVVKHVPFIIFRSLSDLAGGGPGQNEIGTFFQLAANNSAKVMLAFLEALP